MIKFIMGCVVMWLFAWLITLCLHASVTPYMAVTWKSITAIWALILIWAVIWCAIDLKITQKLSLRKYDRLE